MPLAAPFIVLDQSSLRRPKLLEPAIQRARRTNSQLLVLDVAVMEMMKHPVHWERTVRESLAQLSTCPDLVSVGRGTPALMKAEIKGGVACCYELVDVERVEPFRELLLELQQPTGGERLAHIRSTILDAQTKIITAQYLQHEDNQKRLIGFRNMWREILPDPRDRERLRKDPSPHAALIAHPKWTRPIEQLLLEEGHSLPATRRIAYGLSVSAHWTLGMVALGLRWFLQQGLDGRAPTKTTNDLMDLEYIAVGTCCDELVSNESMVNELSALVRDAADIRANVLAATEGETFADPDAAFARHCELTPRVGPRA